MDMNDDWDVKASVIDAREVFEHKRYYDGLVFEGKAKPEHVKVWLQELCDEAEYKVFPEC